MRKPLMFLAATLAVALGGVSVAYAINETAEINYNVKGKFTPKKYKSGKLSFGLNVAGGPGEPTMLPLKVANLRFPPKKTMTFVPRKRLPVCRANATQLSVDPARADRVCGKSLVGNGDATFQLGQSTSPVAFRVGSVYVFYGGTVGRSKDVKLKFSAWSNDTNAGVYAEGILRKNGAMSIAMPRLTSDSSVTSLNMAIPGAPKTITWASGDTTRLKAGIDKAFVRVKCKQGQALKYSSVMKLGSRRDDQAQTPFGPETTLNNSVTSRCGR